MTKLLTAKEVTAMEQETGRIILGLDTDTKGFHWVSTEPLQDGFRMDDDLGSRIGWSQTDADIDVRRVATFGFAKQFFQNLPDKEVHIFCEEPLLLRKNLTTTRNLMMAGGIIYAAFIEACELHPRFHWYWVDVAHWKKEVVGKGSASKDEIREFVRQNPAWRSEVRNPGSWEEHLFETNRNLYDAWCLMVYGVRQLA